MNGNEFATGQILKKPVEVVKGRILAGCAQKSPQPCSLINFFTVVGGWAEPQLYSALLWRATTGDQGLVTAVAIAWDVAPWRGISRIEYVKFCCCSCCCCC